MQALASRRKLDQAKEDKAKTERADYTAGVSLKNAERECRAHLELVDVFLQPYLNKAYLSIKGGGPDPRAKVYYLKALELMEQNFEPLPSLY